MKALLLILLTLSCQSAYWKVDPGVVSGGLEYYICKDSTEVLGALRNKQNATGDAYDSDKWLAEVPVGWRVGTFMDKEAARKRVQDTVRNTR